MGLVAFRTILTTRHVTRLLAASLLARLPGGGLTLSVTLLVVGWTDSYVAAGVTVGAFVLGSALAGPVRGRAVDRRGMRAVLVPTAVLHSTGLLALAMLPAAWWPVAPAVAAVTGLFMPPIAVSVRTLLPRLVPTTVRQSVYTLESTAQELVFIAGPGLAALMLALTGPRLATASLAAATLAGTLWFAAAPPARGSRDLEERRQGGVGEVLATSGVPAVLTAMACLVAAFATVDLAVVAVMREQGMGELAGVLLMVWAAGSLTGGLVATAFASARRPALTRRVAAVTAGLALLVVPSEPVVLGLLLFAGGTTIAPTLGAVYGWLADLAAEHAQSEAFGWLGTAGLIGVAAGSVTGGLVLDHVGTTAAFLTATLFGALALGVTSRSERGRARATTAAVSQATAA